MNKLLVVALGACLLGAGRPVRGDVPRETLVIGCSGLV